MFSILKIDLDNLLQRLEMLEVNPLPTPNPTFTFYWSMLLLVLLMCLFFQTLMTFGELYTLYVVRTLFYTTKCKF